MNTIPLPSSSIIQADGQIIPLTSEQIQNLNTKGCASLTLKCEDANMVQLLWDDAAYSDSPRAKELPINHAATRLVGEGTTMFGDVAVLINP